MFRDNLQISNVAENEIQNTSTTIQNDSNVNLAASKLAQKANEGFNSNVDGLTWGSDLTGEISKGMTNQKSKNRITSAAGSVASWISSFLHFSLPEKGPLSDMDKSMPDMINLMTKGINNNKSKVVNSAEKLASELYNTLNNDIGFSTVQDFGKFQGDISNQIVNTTKTIFTTPQIVFNVKELDKAKLEQCFNYINKKFGSQY